MRCRHTVPDWHRYVATGEDVELILAACRLLIKEGEQAHDSRSIACAYWGHQRDCPLYDGPEKPAHARPQGFPVVAGGDMPLGSEHAWPVRAPGSMDGQRAVLIFLGASSIVLLGVVIAWGVTAASGRALPTAYWVLTVFGGVLSLVTHTLTLLRLWVRG